MARVGGVCVWACVCVCGRHPISVIELTSMGFIGGAVTIESLWVERVSWVEHCFESVGQLAAFYRREGAGTWWFGRGDRPIP